jgi:hypothetical protein
MIRSLYPVSFYLSAEDYYKNDYPEEEEDVSDSGKK